MRNLSTGTWVSVDERCPVRYRVDGSDLAQLVIGEDDQSVELIFNADGLREFVATGGRAVAELDALTEQE